ncbi:MAG: flagellar biosynthesis protein FlgL [Rhizobiales bacterium 62-47]|nr:flagellar biosynthesis protein FlgL [Hyphomicrobiales bacterium]OJY09556.1 MAG: flagellar biosynthesis protein FlgL [Rhizobiales bacterium 62-47]
MAIDGVSGRTSYIGSSILNLKSQLDDLQQQLGSGKISTTYAGQGVNRGLAVALRAQINNINSYADSATNVNTRINVANLSLQGLVDLGTQIKSAANGSSISLGNNGQTSGQVTAQAAFANAIELLNTQSGDRYLFSGRATDTPSTASASDILNGSADGTKAGLSQLIAERKQADLGADGRGRLVLSSPSATAVSVAEDAAPSVFGLKLSAVSTTTVGATATGPTGSPPAATVDFGMSNPSEGDKVRFTFSLPDGTNETIELTATASSTPLPGTFQIGATPAATMANLQGKLDNAVKTLAGTSLVAASAIAASDNFFDQPPLRVDTTSSPLTSATGLIAGTPANTISWYTGEPAQSPTDSARSTAVAQVDQSISTQYGARANEPAFRALLQNIAVYAAVTTSQTDPNANGQITALSQRVTQNMTPQQGVQIIQDIQADFAGAQTAIKASTDRQTQVKTMAQTMLDSIEGVSQDEVATKILALQTSLSASYQTTAMLYQISLTKYLPI